jgi:serine/threonine-protein kinase
LHQQIGTDDLRAILKKILASRAFKRCDSLRRLLQFTVEQAIEGKGDRLKEYVLGVEVFARGKEFDPRIDPIVRVQAGKLRRRLADY